MLCGLRSFKCAAAAIYSAQISGTWTESSSNFIYIVCEQRRLWRDCADAYARLSLRCLPM